MVYYMKNLPEFATILGSDMENGLKPLRVWIEQQILKSAKKQDAKRVDPEEVERRKNQITSRIYRRVTDGEIRINYEDFSRPYLRYRSAAGKVERLKKKSFYYRLMHWGPYASAKSIVYDTSVSFTLDELVAVAADYYVRRKYGTLNDFLFEVFIRP